MPQYMVSVHTCHIRQPILSESHLSVYLCNCKGYPLEISQCFSLYNMLVNTTDEEIVVCPKISESWKMNEMPWRM